MKIIYFLLMLLICGNVYAISPDDLLESNRDISGDSVDMLVYERNQFLLSINEADGLSEIESKYLEKVLEINKILE